MPMPERPVRPTEQQVDEAMRAASTKCQRWGESGTVNEAWLIEYRKVLARLLEPESGSSLKESSVTVAKLESFKQK